MTYVTDQTPVQLRAHMKRLKVMSGWHEPLADRLYAEIVTMDAEIDRLRTQNQALREALKDTAQTLAWMQHGKCRGFSDGLLTTDQALDKARAALAQAEGGV